MFARSGAFSESKIVHFVTYTYTLKAHMVFASMVGGPEAGLQRKARDAHLDIGALKTSVSRAERLPAPALRLGNPGSAFCCPRPGRQPAVESAAPLSQHHPHDAGGSGSGFGAAPRSEFARQRQSCAR